MIQVFIFTLKPQSFSHLKSTQNSSPSPCQTSQITHIHYFERPFEMRFTNALLTVTLSGLAAAHPGHSVEQELQERREFMATSKVRDLSHCAAKLKARGHEARNVARREQKVEAARAKRGLKAKRTLDSVLATDHNATSLGYTPNTDESTLFSSNASCILTPDVTQGPYYVGGEYIRENITEEQEGIDTVLDYQVIDVDTCEPVPNVYLEMWHCNATGVVSNYPQLPSLDLACLLIPCHSTLESSPPATASLAIRPTSTRRGCAASRRQTRTVWLSSTPSSPVTTRAVLRTFTSLSTPTRRCTRTARSGTRFRPATSARLSSTRT